MDAFAHYDTKAMLQQVNMKEISQIKEETSDRHEDLSASCDIIDESDMNIKLNEGKKVQLKLH